MFSPVFLYNFADIINKTLNIYAKANNYYRFNNPGYWVYPLVCRNDFIQ